MPFPVGENYGEQPGQDLGPPIARNTPAPKTWFLDLSNKRPQQIRRILTIWSAVLFIGLPTFLTALYYAVIATDQYAVEVSFAVRAPNGGGGVPSDFLGVMASMGGSAGSTAKDSYIVMNYIQSREIVDKLQQKIDIRKIYSNEEADRFARLDPTIPVEDLVDYWNGMVSVNFDTTSEIITVEVRAFTPETATQVAGEIVAASEALINKLSIRARNDAVKFAADTVARAEDRMRKNSVVMRAFRDKKQEIDPTKTAEARISSLSKLEQEMASARAKLVTLQQYLANDAPNVVFLRNQIGGLAVEIRKERERLGKRDSLSPGAPVPGSTLSGVLADYEEIAVDREFAQKSYVSALASLEGARMEANRQQRYIATFVTPKMPETSLYPKRVMNTLLVLLVASVLWALGLLIVYAIGDHAA